MPDRGPSPFVANGWTGNLTFGPKNVLQEVTTGWTGKSHVWTRECSLAGSHWAGQRNLTFGPKNVLQRVATGRTAKSNLWARVCSAEGSYWPEMEI